MVNVLRPKTQLRYEDFTIHRRAANIEFISSISKFLYEGNVTKMADMKDMFRIIALNNGVIKSQIKSKNQIKKLLENKLESVGIFVSNPKKSK